MHLQNRTCQIRRAGQIYPARGRDFDFYISQPVSSLRLASRRYRVSNDDATRDPFRAEKTLHDRRRQMMAVDDETRPKIVIGQLLPDVIRMAIDLRVGAVAEMGRKSRPGARRVGDLRRSRRGMADGDDDACRRRPFDEINRFGPFGRERDDADPPARGVLPSLKLVPIGSASVLFWVSAARPVSWRNERALDVNADHRACEFRRLVGRS